MPQKAPKEQMPALIAELANRTANQKHMKALQSFLQTVSIPGNLAVELGQAVNWLNNVIIGEAARCAEVKAMLPDQDTEIDLTKPEGTPDQDVPNPPVATAVGGVEMSKGEEVLNPA